MQLFCIYKFNGYQLLHNGYTCSYMFRLNYAAIIRESSPIDTSSVQRVIEWQNIHILQSYHWFLYSLHMIKSICWHKILCINILILSYVNYKEISDTTVIYEYIYFTILWHATRCLCLQRTSPWWWLSSSAATCRSMYNYCAVVGNK